MYRVQRRVGRQFQLVRFFGSKEDADKYVAEYEVTKGCRVAAFEERMGKLWDDEFYRMRPELYRDTLSVVEIEGDMGYGMPSVHGAYVELDDYEIDRSPWWWSILVGLFRLFGMRC